MRKPFLLAETDSKLAVKPNEHNKNKIDASETMCSQGAAEHVSSAHTMLGVSRKADLQEFIMFCSVHFFKTFQLSLDG